MARRLTDVREALARKPINVAEANVALKQAVSKIILDPAEGGTLTINWHHAEDRLREIGPLRSPFQKYPGGYVFNKRQRKNTNGKTTGLS